MKIEDAHSRFEAAGLKLKSKERLPNETGWQLRFNSGEIVNIFDKGTVNFQGKNTLRMREILDMPAPAQPRSADMSPSRTVFVVYGHDHTSTTQLEAMLRRWDLEPVILDQLPSEGQTIIEKLERYTAADVCFAVVLATPDDEGYPRGQPGEKKFRARQNVVLELGMLFAKFGRSKVAILMKDDPQQGMERPSDIQGVLELRFRENVEEVKVPLAKEMEKQGLKIEVLKL